MKISLIAMDLDGTALQADARSFTPRLHAALAAAHGKGVAVLPVTGRQYSVLPPAVHTGAPWEDLCVLCNGAQVRRLAAGELLYSRPILPQSLPPVLELAARLHLPVEFSTNDHFYLTREDWAQAQRESWGCSEFHLNCVIPQRGVFVPSLWDFWETYPVDKVNLLCIPDARRSEVEESLTSLPLSAVWSGRYSMEISHRDATKGNGLRRVCRRLGVPLSEVMALGDSGNDISMLRSAGLGVAMGNAPEEVKSAADAVTASNLEDGAALAIERYVLS